MKVLILNPFPTTLPTLKEAKIEPTTENYCAIIGTDSIKESIISYANFTGCIRSNSESVIFPNHQAFKSTRGAMQGIIIFTGTPGDGTLSDISDEAIRYVKFLFRQQYLRVS